jgi:uncharacterized protein (TIGR00255 family)
MIYSMTGFGSSEVEGEAVRVRVELRSVNSRFCDIQMRRPANLQEFEAAIKERLQSRIARGKVTATIDWEEDLEGGKLPQLDEEVVRRYVQELQHLQDLYGLEGKADLNLLAGLSGVFKTESVKIEPEEAGKLILRAVDLALEDFEQMRAEEGRMLCADLESRVEKMEDNLRRIEAMAAQTREQTRTRLREKIEALLQPGEVDEERLAMEVALIAERSDITEEIVRFHSHNTQFLAALEKGGEVGRRLNFLLQEIHREANTISSKAAESEIIHLVVEIKEDVERLREQVQNLA